MTCHTKELPFITFPANDLFPYIQKQIKTYVSKTDLTWFFYHVMKQYTKWQHVCEWPAGHRPCMCVTGKVIQAGEVFPTISCGAFIHCPVFFCLFFYYLAWTVNWINLKLWQEPHRRSERQAGYKAGSVSTGIQCCHWVRMCSRVFSEIYLQWKYFRCNNRFSHITNVVLSSEIRLAITDFIYHTS